MDIYRERAYLVSYLSKQYPSHLAIDSDEPDWTVVCIHTPNSQMGWHTSKADMDLFKHLTVADNDYDGHTTEDKYTRLSDL